MKAIDSPAPQDIALRDGTRVRFRRIEPEDKHWLQRGIEAMSPESRYRRFFSPVDHLSDAILRYFTEVDHVDHVAWLAVLADDPGGRVVAVARFVRIPGEPDAAEAAVTVIDDFQGRGLGRAILVVMVRDAIEKGIRRFRMFVLGENQAMMGLLHEAGAAPDGVHDGLFKMHVDLPERAEELEYSAAPRILKVAAEGRLRGEAGPGRPPSTRFRVNPT
ncbi:MAG: N-acetyltransferase family protein [Candidatus Dormibacteria bacterium]